ncbi:outer membrane protein transport protein [Aurantiacibacter sp. MUD11]|uniref:OmpP1/FadL family transporter n=1 Tax=Aurantiacibacter sp. MUD11 TaxID=3003265 RepID=UPI0022AAA1A2|nr:outer membrane protein transport protein [Aurantiacibacter sp. MUD11]WAT17697.1 outer membrane protein transport protein [Aurantiacibacter sp. MUD11]
MATTNPTTRSLIRSLRIAAFTGAGILAMASSAAQATDGYFLNGHGAKAKGMGGAAIAFPQDAMANINNPASISGIEGRVDFGVEIFIPDRGAEITGNGAGLDGSYDGNGSNPFVLPEFGYVRPIGENLTFGLSINGNGGMNTDYERANPFAAFGATGDAGVDLKQVFITPTLAYEFTEGHSVGVSAIGLVQGFRASGIQPFAAASADPANFTNRDTDWSFGAGLRIGYYGELSENFAIGAFYQSTIWATEFDKYAGLFADQGGFDVPTAYGAGIAVTPVEGLTFAADVKRIEYSGVNSVGNPLGVLFTGVPFGADDGPGFGWEDVTVFKLGASYDVSESLTLRTGYGRSDNPVPRSETFLNILAPGVVQDHFTVGATWRSESGFELTAYAMRAPRNEVLGLNSIPMNYGGGEANIYLAETAFGLEFGLEL